MNLMNLKEMTLIALREYVTARPDIVRWIKDRHENASGVLQSRDAMLNAVREVRGYL